MIKRIVAVISSLKFAFQIWIRIWIWIWLQKWRSLKMQKLLDFKSWAAIMGVIMISTVAKLQLKVIKT